MARTKKGLGRNQNEVARTKKGLKSAWREQKRAVMFNLFTVRAHLPLVCERVK